MKWEQYFMSLAYTVAAKSKDPSTKVGAVIVAPDNSIRSTGYNGFPRQVDESRLPTMNREEKYMFMAHAEQNAICQAAKSGTHTDGCTIYISSLPPCWTCARMIIQSGITMVVYSNSEVPDRWKNECMCAIKMLCEAGVICRQVNSDCKI